MVTRSKTLNSGAAPPSAAHWLGTDIFGRDLLTQIMFGGRISLAVGFLATAVALLIGITWGAIAGYMGGRVDAVMMRLVDIIYALPFMIFIILLMVVFGRNMLLLFLAIGAVEWLTMARIMRSQVQSLRQQEFVEAAVSLGLADRHNYSSPPYTQRTGPDYRIHHTNSSQCHVAGGVSEFPRPRRAAPRDFLGTINFVMAQNLWKSTHGYYFFPGLALTLTLFSLNFLGDGLRDALDVRGAKD